MMMMDFQNSNKILFVFGCILFVFNTVECNVWTVDCGTLATQRLDPIVFPGKNPAGHVHSIVGGSQFNESVQYSNLQDSQCTTCNVPDDLSNYWVPQLYIKKQKDGKYHFVEMDFHVYYKLINDRGQSDQNTNPISQGDINEFPAGFRMKTGDPSQTSPLYYIEHKCYGPNTNTHEFPPNPEICTRIRSEATFPSCWDGINLDSSDHFSHMAYPNPDGHWEAGPCPSSHPKRVPTLFYEAIFQIQDIYEAGDTLIYSFNDTIGYGFHGDFFNGWKQGAIEKRLNYCISQNDGFDTQCGQLPKQSTNCDWEGTADENLYKGILDDLPPYYDYDYDYHD